MDRLNMDLDIGTARQNFKSWYADLLSDLYPNREAGFMILITSLALLERYLREKSGAHEGQLNNNFHDALTNIFPELTTRDNAKKFWHVFRNGLLHQATMSKRTSRGEEMPSGILSNDFEAALSIDDEGKFLVHPAEFAKRVIQQIESDFTTYIGEGSPDHKLPTEHSYRDYTGTSTERLLG